MHICAYPPPITTEKKEREKGGREKKREKFYKIGKKIMYSAECRKWQAIAKEQS